MPGERYSDAEAALLLFGRTVCYDTVGHIRDFAGTFRLFNCLFPEDVQIFKRQVFAGYEDGQPKLNVLKTNMEIEKPFTITHKERRILVLPLSVRVNMVIERIDKYLPGVKYAISVGYFGQFNRHETPPGFTLLPPFTTVDATYPVEIDNPSPCFELQAQIMDLYRERDLDFTPRSLHSNKDMSPVPDDTMARIAEMDTAGVDMETAAFLDYANKHGINAGCILVAGDPQEGILFNEERRIYYRDPAAIGPIRKATEMAIEVLSTFE